MPLPSNYKYIDQTSADYSEVKNAFLKAYLESIVTSDFSFQTLEFSKFLEIISMVHNLICSEEDKTERTDLTYVLEDEHFLVAGLTPIANQQTQKLHVLSMLDQHQYYACGYSEKGDSLKKLDTHFALMLIRLKGAIKHFGEDVLIAALSRGELNQYLNHPDIEDESKKANRELKNLMQSLGFDNVDQKDRAAVKAFVAKHQAVFAAWNAPAELEESKPISPVLLRLLCNALPADVIQELRTTTLPLFHIFVAPNQILIELEKLFLELKQDFANKKSIFYIAAKLHCAYADIHPKNGSTKRVARVLMNIVLLAGGQSPFVSENTIEMDAYYKALRESIFYQIAAPNEKLKFNPNAFENLIKNKLTMTPLQFNVWLVERYQFNSDERAYQFALKHFQSKENLARVIAEFSPEKTMTADFAQQFNYARIQLTQPEKQFVVKAAENTLYIHRNKSGKFNIVQEEKVLKTQSESVSEVSSFKGVKSGFFSRDTLPTLAIKDIRQAPSSYTGYPPK